MQMQGYIRCKACKKEIKKKKKKKEKGCGAFVNDSTSLKKMPSIFAMSKSTLPQPHNFSPTSVLYYRLDIHNAPYTYIHSPI